MSKLLRAEGRARELLLAGALPASACSGALLALVQPLIESGVLVWERSGSGRKLLVQDSSVLAMFIAQTYPGAETLSELHRVQSVGKYRDSKLLANDSPEIVALRVFKDTALQKNGKPLGAAAWTAEHRVCAVELAAAYRLYGVCALIENPALFFEIEKLALDLDCAILARGRASDRLIEWLAAAAGGVPSVLHFPDYDPVGLSEFLRLQARLSDRVQLYLPADIASRFERFSNGGLLQPYKSSQLLAALRTASHPQVAAVVSLMDQHNGGLEQEALLARL